MNKKRVLVIAIVLVLLLLTAVGGWAMSTASFNLPWTSIMGGGSGGDMSSSASYSLTSSTGGSVQVQSSSASYELCSGFVCDSEVLDIYQVFLPIAVR